MATSLKGIVTIHFIVIILVISLFTIGSKGILLDGKSDQYLYPTLRKQFAESRMNAASKSPKNKAFIINIQSTKDQQTQDLRRLHKLNESNKEEDIKKLTEKIKKTKRSKYSVSLL